MCRRVGSPRAAKTGAALAGFEETEARERDKPAAGAFR